MEGRVPPDQRRQPPGGRQPPATHMSKRGNGRDEAIWLWTGDTEYEGHILSLKGTGVTARLRRCSRRIPVTGAVGTAIPTDVIERQRQLARRIGFAQSPVILAGSLVEFRIVAIQPSQDPEFDVVLTGMFWP